MRRKFLLLLCFSLLVVMNRSARAYSINDNWCDRDELGVKSNYASFRYFTFDANTVDSHLRTALSWWSDAQADIRFYYSSDTTSTDAADPGPVRANCSIQDSELAGANGYLMHYLAYYPSCDFGGLNMDRWRMVMNAHRLGGLAVIGDSTKCQQTQTGWSFVASNMTDRLIPLFETITHELGHALGIGHENSVMTPMPIMSGNSARIMSPDDAAALYDTESWDGIQQIKTVRATRSGGTLTFGTVANVGSRKALWTPVLVPNRWAADSRNISGLDYFLVWANGPGIWPSYHNAQTISVATASDDSSGNLVSTDVSPISAMPSAFGTIGAVVGGYNLTRIEVSSKYLLTPVLGLAYVDRNHNVRFRTSSNLGVDWSETVIPNEQAIGGVSVAYNYAVDRWILSWVRLATRTFGKYQIVTKVSDDSSGKNWTNSTTSYGSFLSSPNLQPSLTCHDILNRCLMVYRTFDTPMIRTIRQQAFEVSNGMLTTLTTNIDTGNYAYSPLGLARLGSDGYLMTFVWPTTRADSLVYRFKSSTAGDTGSFDFDLGSFSSARSRSGFSPAYNYRTGAVRFTWKEN